MEWEELLVDLSKMIQFGIHRNLRVYDESEVENNWLGFPPAPTWAIEKREKDLGIRLPPSYIDFLRVTNGFRQISHFAGRLLPIERIDYLKNIDSDLFDLYLEEVDRTISPSDQKDYSNNQRSVFFNVDHLLSSIAISERVEGSIILLNPQVKSGEEWEAWIFANWYPGAHRYKSFKMLVEDQYDATKKLIKEDR
ncbi:SMI1/KNR4 family protein [Lewinella sp. W8]|uniref:SMI1/KNR4 family protein n=1 Tax=Lewinella sp. W8 TaxID=2528208 RepID=UPI001067E8FB|nr:SMI1/KNR4 family protein [Lewinella sp. W8]MTB53532.1 hypothetical protein [Lewinella sp. W8]